MKLLTVSLYRYKEPFEFSFHSAHMLRAHSESILVRLEFDNAVIGYGESAPRVYVTGETLSSVTRLAKNCFAPLLLGRDIDSMEDIEKALEDLENACFSKKINQYQSALGAFDIALLDALGKLRKVPVRDLIGRDISRDVPLSIAVPFLPVKKIREIFPRIPQNTFQYVKVLVGSDIAINEERVAVIRSLFGDETNLRIDANGKWSFKEALANLKRLGKYGISAVEQPLNKRDLTGPRRLKKQIDIPIIADESLCSLSDARTLLDNEACDIFNIKISKCGGFLRAKHIVDFALSRNVQCQLGSHVGETKILTAAAMHFLTTTSNLLCFEGLSHILFKGLYDPSHEGETDEIDRGELSSISGLGIFPERLLKEADLSPVRVHFSNAV